MNNTSSNVVYWRFIENSDLKARPHTLINLINIVHIDCLIKIGLTLAILP